MAYKINRTGDNVRDLLDSVANKTIYPAASWTERGLMSIADKIKLDNIGIHYNTTEYWNNQRGFIPKAGALVIYSDYKTEVVDGQTVNIPGIKIGSGNAYVQDLAFAGDADTTEILEHIADNVRHTSAVEKSFWSNKLNVTDSEEVVGETLIFNRN